MCEISVCFLRELSIEIVTTSGFFLSFSDGDVFGENPSRKIVSLSFESLLDGKIFHIA